jgi:hypothetical protein
MNSGDIEDFMKNQTWNSLAPFRSFFDKLGKSTLHWGGREIGLFLFREIRNTDKSNFNFTKFCCTFFREISQNFTKFRINYFAKLFRYENFSNSVHKESILINIFWKSYSVPDPGNFGTDPDHQNRFQKNGYGYIQMFMDFWHECYLSVVLKYNKIQKSILPCENFNFVTKISRYLAKFRKIL